METPNTTSNPEDDPQPTTLTPTRRDGWQEEEREYETPFQAVKRIMEEERDAHD